MVYRGRPSRCCLPCRTRKLRVSLSTLLDGPVLTLWKCDLRAGRCGQCTRANFECSGYRDTTELRIRDESNRVKYKVLEGRAPYQRQLTIPIDERARNAFFAHYVAGLSKSYHVIEDLCRKTPPEHVAASLDAASLAYFAFHYQSPQASQLASKRYTDALSLLNAALEAPSSAVSNPTLQAILLLDLFEKTTNNHGKSIASWITHAMGALTVVKLHPKCPYNTDRIRLSVRLSINVLVTCLATRTPLPHAVSELRSDLEPFVDIQDPKWRITNLVIKYAKLQERVDKGLLSGGDLIQQALDLDNQFSAVADGLPTTWSYRRIHNSEACKGVLEQHFDVYSDHHIVQIRNILRAKRILLHDKIRKECKEVTSNICGEVFTTYYSETAAIMIDALAKGICATVPQFTGYSHSTSKRSQYTELQKLQCHTLLWYLYVAGHLASPETGIKNWVFEQLRFMSRDMGIRNATPVLDTLDQARQPDPWAVHTMLGSYAMSA